MRLCLVKGEESACRAGDLHSIPGLGRPPWKRKWQPTPVFLPGESHGQRSLAGCSPWGLKESDTTERLTQLTWQTGMRLCSGCLLRARGGHVRGSRCPPGLHVCLRSGPVSENLVQAHGCAARAYGSRTSPPLSLSLLGHEPLHPVRFKGFPGTHQGPQSKPQTTRKAGLVPKQEPLFLSSAVPGPLRSALSGPQFPRLTMKGFGSQLRPLRSQEATGDTAADPSSPPGPTARRRALGPGPDTEPQHSPGSQASSCFHPRCGPGERVSATLERPLSP